MLRSSPRNHQQRQKYSSPERRKKRYNHNAAESAMLYNEREEALENEKRRKRTNKNASSSSSNSNIKGHSRKRRMNDDSSEEEMIVQQLLYASDVDKVIDEIEHDDERGNNNSSLQNSINYLNNNQLNLPEHVEMQKRHKVRSKIQNSNINNSNGNKYASPIPHVEKMTNYTKSKAAKATSSVKPLHSWEVSKNMNKFATNDAKGKNRQLYEPYESTHKLSQRAADILSNAHSATQPFSSAVSYASGRSSNDNKKNSNTNYHYNNDYVNGQEQSIITEWMRQSSNQNHKRQLVSPVPVAPLLSPTENPFLERHFSNTKIISPRNDFIRQETDNHYNRSYDYFSNNIDTEYKGNTTLGSGNDFSTESLQMRYNRSAPLSPVPDAANNMLGVEDAAHARVARQLQLLKNKERLVELRNEKLESMNNSNNNSREGDFYKEINNKNDSSNNKSPKRNKKMSSVPTHHVERHSLPVKEIVEAQVEQLRQLPMRENSPITVNNNYYFDAKHNDQDRSANHNNKLNRINDSTPNVTNTHKPLLSPRVSAAGLQTYSSVSSSEYLSQQEEHEEEQQQVDESSSRNSTAVIVEYSNDREEIPIVYSNLIQSAPRRSLRQQNTNNSIRLSPRYDIVTNANNNNHNSSNVVVESSHKRKHVANQHHNGKPIHTQERQQSYMENENEYPHTPTATTEEAGSSSSSFEFHKHKHKGKRKNKYNNINNNNNNNDDADDDEEDYFSSSDKSQSSNTFSGANNMNNNSYTFDNDHTAEEYYHVKRHRQGHRNDNNRISKAHRMRSASGNERNRRNQYNYNYNNGYGYDDDDDDDVGSHNNERRKYQDVHKRRQWEDQYQQESNTFPQTWSSTSAVPPPRIIEHEQHRRANLHNNITNTNIIDNNNNNNISNNNNNNNVISGNVVNTNNNKNEENNNDNDDDDRTAKLKRRSSSVEIANKKRVNDVNTQIPHSRALYTPSTIDSELNALKNNSSVSSSSPPPPININHHNHEHEHVSSQTERRGSIRSTEYNHNKNISQKSNDNINNNYNNNIDNNDKLENILLTSSNKPKHSQTLSSPIIHDSNSDNTQNSKSKKDVNKNNNNSKSNSNASNDDEEEVEEIITPGMERSSLTHHTHKLRYSNEAIDDDTPGNPQLQTLKPGSRNNKKKQKIKGNNAVMHNGNKDDSHKESREKQEYLIAAEQYQQEEEEEEQEQEESYEEKSQHNKMNGHKNGQNTYNKYTNNQNKLFKVNEVKSNDNNYYYHNDDDDDDNDDDNRNANRRKRVVHRSYSYPPSSESDYSNSLISENYSDNDEDVNINENEEDDNDYEVISSIDDKHHEHKHKHRLANNAHVRVPSQVTYTQTFRQNNSETLSEPISPAAHLQVNKPQSHNTSTSWPNNLVSARSGSCANRQSYSLRPSMSDTLEHRRLIYNDASAAPLSLSSLPSPAFARKATSQSLPAQRPPFAPPYALQTSDNNNINNSSNKKAVSDEAVSFRSTPIRRTALNVNDPINVTPSVASLNVHPVANAANINHNLYMSNNTNANNTINNNAPHEVRSSVSALRSSSNALRSAQSLAANNLATNSDHMVNGLLYTSLLPKARISAFHTTDETETNNNNNNNNNNNSVCNDNKGTINTNHVITSSTTPPSGVPTAVIPILPPTAASYVATPVQPISASKIEPMVSAPTFVQANVYQQNNSNNNNNNINDNLNNINDNNTAVNHYEPIDETRMHRMDHGRWKKYAKPKPFSSLFRPHHSNRSNNSNNNDNNHKDKYNYYYHPHKHYHHHEHDYGEKKNDNARLGPEPMVQVISTTKKEKNYETFHVHPEGTNVEHHKSEPFLRHETTYPDPTQSDKFTSAHSTSKNNSHVVNEPFYGDDSCDTSRVVKVVERRTLNNNNNNNNNNATNTSTSITQRSNNLEQQQEQQSQSSKRYKPAKSVISSDVVSSSPTFVSSSYGVVGEERVLQPLVWTSGSSSCVMGRNHKIPKPPHLKAVKHVKRTLSTNNVEPTHTVAAETTRSAKSIMVEKDHQSGEQQQLSSSAQRVTFASDTHDDANTDNKNQQYYDSRQWQAQQTPNVKASLPVQPVSVLSLISKSTNADKTPTTTNTNSNNYSYNGNMANARVNKDITTTNTSQDKKSLQFDAKPVITSTPNKSSVYTQSYKERFHVQPLTL